MAMMAMTATRLTTMTRKKRKTVRLLLDADPIVYACGFASQHHWYVAVATDDTRSHDAGTKLAGPTEGLRALQDEMAEAWPAVESWTAYEHIDVEPVAYALNSVKKQIMRIHETVEAWAKRPAIPELYLTGAGNFREQIATIRPYKGNRKPWHKPRLEREIKTYMIERWDATVCHGQEADDMVSIRQISCAREGAPSVIVSIDKDLLMVPGWHYNPNKDEFHKTKPKEGMCRFYRQVIAGDSVDNIGGAYKLGAKAAEKLITPKMTQRKMWETVLDAYAASAKKWGTEWCNDLQPHQAALECARLIWMRRKPGEIWESPQ